ncbi:hypothetical protein LVJ82_02395 [Vitreoscilla massiliensis]|uniref:Uncharacterized protein n=1 Tax=Vitreoscilla massiliensis TaxID=1689272 RepID=A0ABY4E252_9NEIS|nr:hypothetical protein [Vitreoscilla massiliensis]UOO89857.1 hypothetical protein LVJ82_02395 [Vitreoscilla massiliensis]
MIKRISLLALFSLCAVVQAQNQHHLVNGITLNDSLAKVKQQLGQPSSETRTDPNECNEGAPDLQLRYPGMVVTLSPDAKQQYSVSSIDITSAALNVSGIRLGDSASQVKRVFGSSDMRNNVMIYDFEPQSGQTYEFTVRGGKVSHIKFNSYMC